MCGSAELFRVVYALEYEQSRADGKPIGESNKDAYYAALTAAEKHDLWFPKEAKP